MSRSIAACQGALLLVDSTKGVQAQTVANFFLAFEQDLEILPVVNKVDLGHADVEGTLEQIATAFDIDTDDALCISAKTGIGTDAILPAIIQARALHSSHLHGHRAYLICMPFVMRCPGTEVMRCTHSLAACSLPSECLRQLRGRMIRYACCSSMRGMTTFGECSAWFR